MPKRERGGFDRREFLRRAGLIGGTALAGALGGCGVQSRNGGGEGAGSGVAVICDPGDPLAAAGPVLWAAGQLVEALKARHFRARIVADDKQAADAAVWIYARTAEDASAHERRNPPRPDPAMGAESFVLAGEHQAGRTIVMAAGVDARGLVYGLLELAERVRFSAQPLDDLGRVAARGPSPANKVRGIMRLFVSDVEDKGWFHDKDFWQRYLTMLVSNRFNRFNLALGLGYDGYTGLRDTYLFFAYPFLLSVPGYDVRAVGLTDEERDANLRMVRYISDEAARRGLHFQLGLWTHAYQWENSPRANYTIAGLTPDRHAAYCRDALAKLLEECPNIHGITFRVHGESGIAEGSNDFWKTVFAGVARSAGPGRPLEIDMHAKGMDQTMIEMALATGAAVTLSPKFIGEHMGLPYHAASIRELEMPKGRDATGQFALSNGTRSFLRYGYGDLLTEERKYGVIHRVWPGTQRVLLWGDSAYAADYGRAFGFCGSLGVEYFDPLGFKGRKGTGIDGGGAGRSGYADLSLAPAGGDWEKYLLTYRMWGRMSYDPESDPEECYREMKAECGARGPALIGALGSASRILPLVTTAHAPSAGNNDYWPEVYVNQSIVDAGRGVYNDTPTPRIFGNVSALDPQIFAGINAYVDGRLRGERLAKISPLEVARQLEAWAGAAMDKLAEARKASGNADGGGSGAARRAMIDVSIAAGLGRFFAAKMRAGMLWGIFEQTGYEPARKAAVSCYQRAREAWAGLAEEGKVYASDLTFGTGPARGQTGISLRGHWRDRLGAIDTDIAAVETGLANPRGAAVVEQTAADLVAEIVRSEPPGGLAAVGIVHTPAAAFVAGEALTIRVAGAAGGTVRLCYRHVNQGERYVTVEGGGAENGGWTFTIPGAYTQSPFGIQYYFEVHPGTGAAMISPGFREDFRGQPYHMVRRARGG